MDINIKQKIFLHLMGFGGKNKLNYKYNECLLIIDDKHRHTFINLNNLCYFENVLSLYTERQLINLSNPNLIPQLEYIMMTYYD